MSDEAAIKPGDLPPLDQYEWNVPCDQFHVLTGHDPYYPTDMPAGAGRPLCEIEPPRGPQSRDLTGQYDAGVLYVPDGLSPTTSDYIQVIDAGGVLVSETFNIRAQQPLWDQSHTADTNPNGQPWAVRTTIRGGKAAHVYRTPSPDRVGVDWYETDTSGSMVKFTVQAHYSPDEVYAIAQSLTPGTPPDELPVTSTTSTSAPPPPPTAPGPPSVYCASTATTNQLGERHCTFVTPTTSAPTAPSSTSTSASTTTSTSAYSSS